MQGQWQERDQKALPLLERMLSGGRPRALAEPSQTKRYLDPQNADAENLPFSADFDARAGEDHDSAAEGVAAERTGAGVVVQAPENGDRPEEAAASKSSVGEESFAVVCLLFFEFLLHASSSSSCVAREQ